MSFFAELKRRNVFRVAASYALIAWIVLQVISTISPALNIPLWVLSFVTVLLLLGFPLALYVSWAYEITSEGIKPSSQVPVEESLRAQTGHRMNYLIVGELALLLVLVGIDAFLADEYRSGALLESAIASAELPPPPVTTAVSSNSIAILPFDNLSSDLEQEYFSDGLTEELMSQLARVRGLQVAGRTSSFTFKNSGSEARSIGQALGVANILTGSVRKAGNRVRVSAQLARAADSVVLWTDTYDRDLTDIFAIQDDIAEAVTTALSVTMGAGDFGLPGMTRDIEAYDAYLRGMQSFRVFSGRDSMMATIDEFERAVNLDPGFARAWIQLAAALDTSNQFLTEDERAGFATRIAEARAQVRAVVPDLPELHLLDAADLIRQRQLLAAEAEFLAYRRQVTTPAGASMYGRFLNAVGRSQEALQYFLEARRLEPLEAEHALFLAIGFQNLGRLQEAEAEIERGLALDGLDEYIAGQRVMLAYNMGDKAGALRAVEQMETTPDFNLVLGRAWANDDREDGLATIRGLMRDPLAEAAKILLAQWASVFGDHQLALDLRGSSRELTTNTMSLWMPYNSAQRRSPAFKDYVRDIGLLDYWRSSGKWADACRPVGDDFECE